MAKGIEPDPCFYIAHERAIRGKRTIDLGTDPPPDLALGIDITTRRDHRAIYAALRAFRAWVRHIAAAHGGGMQPAD